MLCSVIGLVFIFSYVCINAAVPPKSCSLDVKYLPRLAPVFLTSQNKLAKNVGKLLRWKVGETGEILCNGRENELASYGKKYATIQCRNDGLYVNGEKGTRNIACLKEIEPDILISEKACINGGLLRYIGFRTSDKKFAKYITICYNDKKNSPVYVYHKIWGRGSRYVSPYQRPFFKLHGLVSGVNPVSIYYDQNKSVQDLLGKKSQLYMKTHSPVFTKGHLTPSSDGLFKSWQLSTFYFINSAPQFDDVNGKNWATVEKLVRNKAVSLKEELEVYTGVSGVLALPNDNNELTPIYLRKDGEKGTIPVPRWFWKIAKFKDEGIAFITWNNPHVRTVHPMCDDICKKYGWHDEHFSNYKLGFTICCSVESLMNVFPEVPPTAKVHHVLNF